MQPCNEPRGASASDGANAPRLERVVVVPLRALQSPDMRAMITASGAAATIVVHHANFDVAPVASAPYVSAVVAAAVAALVLPSPLHMIGVAGLALACAAACAPAALLVISRHRPGQRVPFGRTLQTALGVEEVAEGDAIELTEDDAHRLEAACRAVDPA
jgi:hypothetical protein